MSPEEGTTIHRSTIELLDKLDKYLKQRDDYKAQRDTLIDDIAVLRGNNERLEEGLKTRREETDNLEAKLSAQLSMKRDLEKENKHLKERINKAEELIEGNIETLKMYGGIISKNYELEKENEKLERENEKQLELLKKFSGFINFKLWVSPTSDTYKHYRSELNKLGVK